MILMAERASDVLIIEKDDDHLHHHPRGDEVLVSVPAIDGID